MNYMRVIFASLFISVATFAANSEAPATDPSKEAPNILYVVPWNETPTKKAKDPKLVLHDLVGDLYDPQIPSDW